MILLVGLGNPGNKYQNTRHNMGFMAVDKLALDLKVSFQLWGQGKTSELAQLEISGKKVFIQKPLTYMNLSGEAVSELSRFYKIPPENVCAVYDELDLPFGEVRLKIGGGDGGHNGLKSLSSGLSSTKYSRIRMGIGRPPHPDMDPADYVLSVFKPAEKETVNQMIEKATEACQSFVDGVENFKRLMNRFNQKAPKV